MVFEGYPSSEGRALWFGAEDSGLESGSEVMSGQGLW